MTTSRIPRARTQVEVVARGDDKLRRPLDRQLAHELPDLGLVQRPLPAPVTDLRGHNRFT